MPARPTGALLLLALAVSACGGTSARGDGLIVPGERVGPIRSGISETELAALLPEGQLVRDLYSIGEDFYHCGTTAFAGTDEAVFVLWDNGPHELDGDGPETRAACDAHPEFLNPISVNIRRPWSDGETPPTQTWHTEDGIRLGMTLNALAELSGGPVMASMCGCDFGGVVFPFQDQPLPEHLAFWIDFPADVETRLGAFIDPALDYELSSADIPPDMQAGFVVDRIEVEILLPPPGADMRPSR